MALVAFHRLQIPITPGNHYIASPQQQQDVKECQGLVWFTLRYFTINIYRVFLHVQRLIDYVESVQWHCEIDIVEARGKMGVSWVNLHSNAMSSLKTGWTDASCFSRIRESVGFSRSMWPCGPRGMTHRSWILSSTCTYTFCATFVLWTRVNRVFSYIILIPSSCHIFNLPVVDQIKNAFP